MAIVLNLPKSHPVAKIAEGYNTPISGFQPTVGWEIIQVMPDAATLHTLVDYMNEIGKTRLAIGHLDKTPTELLGQRLALMELHKAMTNGPPLVSPMQIGIPICQSIHKDDYSGVNGRVHTLLIYINCTAEGGELLLYGNGERPAEEPTAVIITNNIPDGYVKVVLLPSDMWHCPAPIYGVGVCDIFVFKYPQICTQICPICTQICPICTQICPICTTSPICTTNHLQLLP